MKPISRLHFQNIPIICDHPEWWVVVSLDGFGLHCNIHLAQKIFADHKIFIIKEEADTSQTNQSYDQLTAKKDKAGVCHTLDLITPKLGVETNSPQIMTSHRLTF
jgi:hypothetical protein